MDKNQTAGQSYNQVENLVSKYNKSISLDVLIAEHVMGSKITVLLEDSGKTTLVALGSSESESTVNAPKPLPVPHLPHYSGEYDAAFEVVGKIRTLENTDGFCHWYFALKDVAVDENNKNQEWAASLIYRPPVVTPVTPSEIYAMSGEDIPLAICRAALLAMAKHYGVKLQDQDNELFERRGR